MYEPLVQLTRVSVQFLECIPHAVVADFTFKIVERLCFGHVAHSPPFRVTRNPVITTTLYVHGRQV